MRDTQQERDKLEVFLSKNYEIPHTERTIPHNRGCPEMILSKNILPSAVEGTEDLYYRTEGDITIDDGNIILGKDSSFSLYTFFNLFPLAHYRKYTTVS